MAFTYNEQDVKRESADTALSPGAYKMVVDGATCKANDNGDAVVNLRVSPLDPEDGETRRRPNLFHRMVLPLRNEEVPDHVPPDWAKRTSQELLCALFPEEIPLPPQRIDGSWQFAGEEIDPSEVEEKREEATEALMRKCAEVAENPAILKDYTFFAKVVHREGGFVNLTKIGTDLPAGETLVPLDQFTSRVSRQASGGKTSEEKAPTKANGKTNGKAVAPAKKNGKK